MDHGAGQMPTFRTTEGHGAHGQGHWNRQNDVLFKADVTKAHCRVKVLVKHWRYQAAQIRDQWCINQVGAYGMASAQLYLILRFIYRLVLAVDWGFVFVDAFCWILRQKHAHRHTALFLAPLFAMIPPELEENQTCPGQPMARFSYWPQRASGSNQTRQT